MPRVLIKGRLEKDIFWYKYIYPKNLVLFDNEKLVAPEISRRGNFSYDIKGEFYSTTKIYGYIKKDTIVEDYRFWLGLLNSQLFWFFIQNTGYVLRGGYFTFKTDYIQPFPVPEIIPDDTRNKIILAVDNILSTKENNLKNNTSELELAIDKHIYTLYGLSEEDINIIETCEPQ